MKLAKKEKLVNAKKYGFKINHKYRAEWRAKSQKIFLRKSVAEALAKARSYLPEGYNFEIHDGKRSVEDQRKIIKICEKNFKKKCPKNWHNLLVRYTGGYKYLNHRPFVPASHLGGGAADLTVIKERKEINMGGTSFNEKDNLNYFEKKKKLTKKENEIKENRRLLKKAMRKAGFKAYAPEWWHWGYMK